MTTLIILDGFGLAPQGATYRNAIQAAHMPCMQRLLATCPHTTLDASGEAVGLPAGQMGNSEVGHLNIGAGRVVLQDLQRIGKDIKEGTFFQSVSFQGRVHFLGLLSDGGVHSHIDHLYALIDRANACGVTPYVHCILDGRDTPPTSGLGYLRDLLGKTQGKASVASVMGRFYAMDRDNRWQRIQAAYNVLTQGGEVTDPVTGLEQSYADGKTDEFVLPFCCNPEGTIRPGDTVVFYNFRPDRARELTRAFVDPAFDKFSRIYMPLTFYCMSEYDATMPNVTVMYPNEDIQNTLGAYLASCGKTQARIAETEKYAHVTFFLNGGIETPNRLEDRFLIPSPKVETYDLKPEMSAFEVAWKASEEIPKHDFVCINLANCDMVGHTGVFSAAVQAAEAVDQALAIILEAVESAGGNALVIADHGNAECMTEPDGSPMTAHTTNRVPCIAVHAQGTLQPGRLCDVAPTLLTMMGLPIPKEMTGISLLKV